MHYKEIAEFLLSHGASINMQDKNGEIALHHAIMHDCKELSKFIDDKIEYLAINLLAMKLWNKLRNPMDFNDLIELLLSNGADVNAKFKESHSPLHVASVKYNIKLVEILISHGADVNALNEIDKTPLDNVIKRESLEDDTDILEKLKKVRRILISHGGKLR
ncbi:ankyrin repeat protein, putative [Trichomonas vaginalis G3]|uniref:Ankyrin repeat protein, putative n=1 Tax=Trichomonas vaginalis (strain ATCC PRA-98 / G3) TaxID=412133 RepID=A2EP11_TRIV3|nr:spectrin binding [Trichomonas vaginalis G3]EAY05615.1 ankyrin repeat protein, putative [Trichomonas vaginalis G3]KAI5486855.1 spectrin binding [Trichomonas vaginalis G3]|eukprot:XP_001317838.1 ankyrin repeat protein [Trichomonas vaginalis G3]